MWILNTFGLRSLFGLVVGLSICLFVGACGGSSATLQPLSMSRPPSIDASLTDWKGGLTRMDDRSVSVGTHPTDSLLYVALLIQDRATVRAVAKHGLIVWVDPANKKRHAYGLQYPFGLRFQRARQTKSRSAPNAPGNSSQIENVLPSDLAVIRNDTIRHRLPAQFATKPRVKIDMSASTLIYEAAIPLQRAVPETASEEYRGVTASLGTAFGLGVETPKPEDSERFSGKKSGIPSVTGSGRRGRRPRRRRRQRKKRQKPSTSTLPRLELWAKVTSQP